MVQVPSMNDPKTLEKEKISKISCWLEPLVTQMDEVAWDGQGFGVG